MYYNKSTFPIFLYPMEKTYFSLDKIYENFTFITNRENFEIEFLEKIEIKEKQDLFGYLMTSLPSVIITNFREFKRGELKFEETIDDSLFELSNLRIDLKLIYEKLVELESNILVEKCSSEIIITDLCHFIFQYLFIQLSKCIYATEFKNKKFLFDIKINSSLYQKYSANDVSKLSIDKIVAQDNFIKGYRESFGNLEESERKLIEDELIYMSNIVNQKKRLKSIFDNNIDYCEGITKTKKNSLLLYFFKNVTCKLYFKYLDIHQIDDYEVSEAYRTFRKRT